MAVSIGSGFALHKKAVIDDRTYFETVSDMVATPDNWMADMGYAFVKETGKMYVFNRDNDVLDDLGKWRLFDPDGAAVTTEIVSAINVGMIKEGTTYAPGTSFEDIFRDLLSGKQLEDEDFYYGVSNDGNVVSLYQFDGSTSSACTVTPNNQYVVFAAKESLGEFNVSAGGWNYTQEFNTSQLTHNGILYNVLVSKTKITAPSGFQYQLTFN